MYSKYHEEFTRRLAAQVWNDDEVRHLSIDWKLASAIARKFIGYVAAVEPDPTYVPPVEEPVIDAGLVVSQGLFELLNQSATKEVDPANSELIYGENPGGLPEDFQMPTGEVVSLREYVDTMSLSTEDAITPNPELLQNLNDIAEEHGEPVNQDPIDSPAAEAPSDTPVVEPEAAVESTTTEEAVAEISKSLEASEETKLPADVAEQLASNDSPEAPAAEASEPEAALPQEESKEAEGN